MKKGDIIWGLLLAAIIAFLIIPATNQIFTNMTAAHPFLMGFIKFAILASMGEFLAIRIIKGSWEKPVGFMYKMIIWGIIGVIIVYMFKMFPMGVKSTIDNGLLPIGGGIAGTILTAFLTSSIMNLTFGPMFMAAHRVSDSYIDGICQKQKKKVSEIIADTDWAEFIRFVLGKTIPFFWIPMHTISFLLPVEYRVLSAAFLSIALGGILAYAKRKSTSAKKVG